ncbi:MAG: TIGR00296 family protein [Nanoarchaeota archaeon]
MIAMSAKYSSEQGKEFIELARKAIESKFSGEKVSIPDKIGFKQARGVFVTLTKSGRLRGCIGYPNSVFPIGEAIVKSATAAAFDDSKFSPLKEEEIEKIKIELSILTEPYLFKGSFKELVKSLELGKDGLICEYMGYRGLLLPQVALEHRMDKIKFLEAVCEKTGLNKDYWQNPNVGFYKFQVQVFREE